MLSPLGDHGDAPRIIGELASLADASLALNLGAGDAWVDALRTALASAHDTLTCVTVVEARALRWRHLPGAIAARFTRTATQRAVRSDSRDNHDARFPPLPPACEVDILLAIALGRMTRGAEADTATGTVLWAGQCTVCAIFFFFIFRNNLYFCHSPT
jgi:hypothetical protein